MSDKNSKNIFVLSGIYHSHFTGTVEVIKELISLGHNVTVLVLDEFESRIKDVGAKIIVNKIDRSKIILPPGVPPYAINSYIIANTYDAIFTFLSKEENKYDYYIFDSFFDIQEMNKILKIPLDKFILICAAFIITDVDYSGLAPNRTVAFKPINIKYNINLTDFIMIHYKPNKFKKLILTSKFLHYKGENTDDTCFFIGPNIEKRKFDENFKFKKDKNKKLIFFSFGSIDGMEYNFYLKCIEAFKNSEEYQVLLSVGKFLDINKLGDIPKNFSVFNFVPQTQILPEVDIFVIHGGLNSVQEGLFSGLPLIIVPQRNDQFENAKRIEELGAGITLDKNKISADVLKNAVNNININREKYKKGVDKIVESFKECIANRKNIYEKIFV